MVEIALETQAYQDLPKPVILTSGELGIYYINTEKYVQDGGEFNKYGDDSVAMIQHANRMVKEHRTFGEAIDIMAQATDQLLAGPNSLNCAISGRQRRDWLFSGPIASALRYPHISLYKDGSSYLIKPDFSKSTDVFGFRVVHISDLLTVGSSSYDPRKSPPTGWVPMLRNQGNTIQDLVTVVTRLQGGEEVLAGAGVNVISFVPINEEFLEKYSSNPKRAAEYKRDPHDWGERYLRENGVQDFVGSFAPEKMKKDNRAAKFLDVYKTVLAEDGARRYQELQTAVKEQFGLDIDTLRSGLRDI